MKILILGSNGRLGNDLANYLQKNFNNYFKIIRSNRSNYDLSKYKLFNNYISLLSPDFIINCAAFTNIISAEENSLKAFAINSFFLRHLAAISQKKNIPIIHFSTEHIFDGKKNSAYIEDDKINPKNKYGVSKYWGEFFISNYLQNYYILRTTWLISYTGNNFLTKIIEKQKQKLEFNVVSDQIGVPVTTDFISRYVGKILINFKNSRLPFGTYHLTPSGEGSRYELAKIILKIASELNIFKPSDLIFPSEIKSSEYSSNVIYPLNCVLSSSKIRKLININMNDYLYDLRYLLTKKYYK